MPPALSSGQRARAVAESGPRCEIRVGYRGRPGQQRGDDLQSDGGDSLGSIRQCRSAGARTWSSRC